MVADRTPVVTESLETSGLTVLPVLDRKKGRRAEPRLYVSSRHFWKGNSDTSSNAKKQSRYYVNHSIESSSSNFDDRTEREITQTLTLKQVLDGSRVHPARVSREQVRWPA